MFRHSLALFLVFLALLVKINIISAYTCEPYCIFSSTIQFNPPRQCDQIKCNFDHSNAQCSKCLAQCTKKAFTSTNINNHCKSNCKDLNNDKSVDDCQPNCKLVCQTQSEQLKYTLQCKQHDLCTSSANLDTKTREDDIFISDSDHEGDDFRDYVNDVDVHDQSRDVATSTRVGSNKEEGKGGKGCKDPSDNDGDEDEEEYSCEDQDSFEYEASHNNDKEVKEEAVQKPDNDPVEIVTIIEKCCPCDDVKNLIKSYQSASSKLMKSIELIDTTKIPTFVELLHQYHLTGFPSCCECAPQEESPMG